mgnify:CR=1 FL=1
MAAQVSWTPVKAATSPSQAEAAGVCRALTAFQLPVVRLDDSKETESIAMLSEDESKADVTNERGKKNR